MKKKILHAGLIAVLLAFSFYSRAQTTMTLKQCIETGIASNFDVLQRDLQAQRDKANWKQERLNIFPDLNGFASHDFSQGRSIDPYTNAPVTQAFNSSNYDIRSNVILFNGLSIQNSIKEKSLTYQASIMAWQQEKDDLTINIILAYLRVLSNADQLEQARNQLTVSGKHIERLEILAKDGAVRPAELSDLKGQYAGEQLAIITAQNALQSEKVALSRLMNVPYNKELVLEKIEPELFTAKYENTPDKIYQAALQHMALIKAVDFRQQSAGKALKVARGQLFPTLRFGASASTSYSSVAFQNQYINTVYVPTSDSAVISNIKYPVYRYRDNFTPLTKISYKDQLNNNIYTSFGFSLNIPIFNKLNQRNLVKQAKINLKNQELNAASTRTDLSLAIEQAYINMNSASDRYKALLDQVNAYNESFRVASILFQEGVGNSIDYLITKNNFDRANIDLIAAKYDYVLRTKILDYYQGKQLW
jgi:outer membrane protein